MTCDHCQQEMFLGNAGYFVGEDGASDCPESLGGHTVYGDIRERV